MTVWYQRDNQKL